MNRFSDILQSQSRAVYLAFLLIALAGFWCLRQLPSDVYPELSFPRIAVIADVGDVAPDRVVLTVTRVLEEAASQVYGIRWIRSKTIRGSAELSIDFQPRTDMQLALQQLQARLAEVRATLPAGVNLTVERVTPAIFPVLSFNISTSTLTQADLYNIARYQLQPQLTRVPGVARVQLQGGDIPEVDILVDQSRLTSYGISLSQVSDALARANQVQVAGKLDEQYQQHLVVATGEATRPEDLGNVVVATKAGVPIFVRDLGRIIQGHADRTRIVSVDGKPGLTLNIFRQPSSNVVEVSRGVNAELDVIRKTLPAGLDIRQAYDESGLVTDAMNNVRDAIVIGIALIIVVLYVFLREWRSTVIASITIPLSALAAFAVMALFGQSLNLMSLGGLAVAIGLVIDDAIVVIENIDRQLRHGLRPSAAVRAAMTELVEPVFSSTVTTVVVFLPLGLLSGVAGQFFTSLTFTLAAAVIFSLVLAFTLTPLLSAQWLKGEGHTQNQGLLARLDHWYADMLHRVLRRPERVALAALVLLGVGAGLYTRLGSDFLPAFDEGSFILDYLTPPGTSLAATDAVARKLENILAHTPEVAAWTRRTGAENGLFATEPNKGDIQVVLKPPGQRSRKIDAVIEDLRGQIAEQVPQADTDFHQVLQDELNDLSGAASPVEVRIFGEDPPTLVSLAAQAETKLAKVLGLVDLVNQAKEGAPQYEVHVDPVRAGRIGLATAEVAAQAQAALLGNVSTQMRQGDRLVDVRVRMAGALRTDPQRLARLPIIGSNGESVPLGALASIDSTTGPSTIYRENQRRYVSLIGNTQNRDLGSVVRDVQAQLNSLGSRPGYNAVVGGLYESQQQAFSQLLLVLAMDVILVYFVLVAQFQSWVQPLAIFTAVPLALIGVVALLWVTGTPLNVSSSMGVILLVGLVVKNGIILLEYTNRLHEGGVSLEAALVEAGRVRLRPILMTTLCTLLGLLPLALGWGAGAELQKPLAIAVIGGLSLSTVFTLVFVPVVFLALSRERSEEEPPAVVLRSEPAEATRGEPHPAIWPAPPPG